MPDPAVGGVLKNFFIISNYLAKEFRDISIITIDNSIKKKLDKKIKIISLNNSRFKKSGIYIKYLVCILLLTKELLFNRKCTILTFQGNWYAIIIAKIFGVSILTRSNTAPDGWSKNILKNFFYKLILNLSDEIIVNSNEFSKKIKKKFNLNSKTIYNPLNKKEIIRLSKKKIKFDYFKTNKFIKIINYGRFADQKNQIILLKSIANLDKKIKIRVLLAGEGPEKDKIKNFIIENNLQNKIKLMNFIKNPYPYLKMADFFILTSNFEGLPNVLLEAQTLKKIIISTNCPSGPKEILNNGMYGYLFKIGNHRDLTKKILSAIKNKNLNKKMVKQGFQNLTRFDNVKNLEKYKKILSRYL